MSWQNSMYLYALGDKEIEKSYCEWLKKGEIGKLEELYIVDYEEIKKLVNEYKNFVMIEFENSQPSIEMQYSKMMLVECLFVLL